jgi:LysR family transcriptional regulator, glycine cleavage system transcriptional activator
MHSQRSRRWRVPRMSRALPSLDLIRGFEAAARQLSFTKAAGELFLTQSAVSRQVQALEEHLGVALFERRHREIRLTDAGQQLYRSSVEALRLLTDTAARIRDQGASRAVTVTCSIGFASLWLVPRLMEFREQHPEIDIRIDANNRIVDLDRDRVEVAVRYCPKAEAPAAALQLFEDEVYAVCSPSLLERADRPLAEPADLRHHVLLHYQGADTHWAPGSWHTKLETLGLRDIEGAGSLQFNQYDQLIQAAIEGQGIALGVGPLVRRLIQQGRLVALFGKRFASPRGYYLLAARYAAGRPEVTAFTDWLLATALREIEEVPPLPRAQRASPAGRSERDSRITGTSPTSTIASDGKAASARRSSRAS